MRVGRASLRDARRKIAIRFVRRCRSAQIRRSRSQRPTEARLAGRNRAVDRRGRRHERDHETNRKVQDLCLRWQERFIEEGFDGLLRDKTRPSRIKPLGVEAAERVVALTRAEPPGETTMGTGPQCRRRRGSA